MGGSWNFSVYFSSRELPSREPRNRYPGSIVIIYGGRGGGVFLQANTQRLKPLCLTLAQSTAIRTRRSAVYHEGGREGGRGEESEGARGGGVTYTGGEHAGGSLVEVEGAHTPHAVSDEGENIATQRHTHTKTHNYVMSFVQVCNPFRTNNDKLLKHYI